MESIRFSLRSDSLIIGNHIVIDLGTNCQIYLVGIKHDSPPMATKIRCVVLNEIRVMTCKES